MAPSIPFAAHAVTYPLYCCEFDPHDANRLVVAGGGGASRTGVGNKISILDVSQPSAITPTTELDLGRDEDNPTTIAVGLHKGKTTLLYAGINSGDEDIKKGKNEHFRVFGIDQPSKANAVLGPRISELSRSSLFSGTDSGAYQRLLRISPAFEGSTHQVGAVATGFAKQPEIVLFDVSSTGTPAPKPRGKLELSKEAMDLDIIQTGDDQWQLAYCDDSELHLMDISSKSSKEPQLVYTMPHDDNYNVRPKFRSIRYLTSGFILATTNIPNGVIVYGLRLPKPGKADGKARVAVSRKLPKLFARAVGLAVRNLSPVTTPGARQGDTQFLVAIASNGGAIILYTLQLETMAEIDLLTKLNPITTLKEIHGGAVTDLNFSHFTPPKSSTMRQLHLRLASVSTNFVVVHTLPLKKFLGKAAPARKGGPPRQARYVVALKSEGPSPTGVLVTLAVAIALMAILAQFFFELKGISPPVMGAHKIAPASWARPMKPAPSAGLLLTAAVAGAAGDGAQVVVLDGEGGLVKVDTHDQDQHGDAKTWEELPKIQKDAWKARLKHAGHWGEEMGETILKSLFFGEIAGLVEGVVRG